MKKIILFVALSFIIFCSGCSEMYEANKAKCYPPSQGATRNLGSITKIEREVAMTTYTIFETDQGSNIVVSKHPVASIGDLIAIQSKWEYSEGTYGCKWSMTPCLKIGDESGCHYIIDSKTIYADGVMRIP